MTKLEQFTLVMNEPTIGFHVYLLDKNYIHVECGQYKHCRDCPIGVSSSCLIGDIDGELTQSEFNQLNFLYLANRSV